MNPLSKSRQLNLSYERSAQLILKIEQFFQTLDRLDKVEAMPFPVSTPLKHLKADCNFIRVKEVNTFNIYHCIQEELVENYVLTNNNLANCEKCPYYIKE